MSNEKFNDLMNQLSSEAEGQRAEDVRQLARQALRSRVKSALLSLVVIGLFAVGYYKRVEIQDAVTQLTRSSEPEYKQILKIADEVDAEKPGKAAAASDPSSRNAKLKDAVRKAKDEAAVVDGIMDYDPTKTPPATPHPKPTPKS